ncbi:hypothetical protein AFL94_03145 [Arthrobacter sp. LS16]|nr:hypothetical protein AFL94_03145 [Arthrobacter sp. LS16]
MAQALRFNTFFTQPFIKGADVDTEVFSDLCERDIGVTIQGDPHDVVTELFGITRRHGFILPGQQKLVSSNVT